MSTAEKKKRKQRRLRGVQIRGTTKASQRASLFVGQYESRTESSHIRVICMAQGDNTTTGTLRLYQYVRCVLPSSMQPLLGRKQIRSNNSQQLFSAIIFVLQMQRNEQRHHTVVNPCATGRIRGEKTFFPPFLWNVDAVELRMQHFLRQSLSDMPH